MLPASHELSVTLHSSLFVSPLFNDFGHAALLTVNFVIELAHLCGREHVAEALENGAQSGRALERVAADEDDGFVGRKVLAVVCELEEIEGGDESVGRIAGDDVHMAFGEGAVS